MEGRLEGTHDHAVPLLLDFKVNPITTLMVGTVGSRYVHLCLHIALIIPSEEEVDGWQGNWEGVKAFIGRNTYNYFLISSLVGLTVSASAECQ
eukprot:scaffold134273_cov14-Tisochrysis_lutea.AAC.1